MPNEERSAGQSCGVRFVILDSPCAFSGTFRLRILNSLDSLFIGPSSPGWLKQIGKPPLVARLNNRRGTKEAQSRKPRAFRAQGFPTELSYLNLNMASCMAPSSSFTCSILQVPAHALSVFQT